MQNLFALLRLWGDRNLWYSLKDSATVGSVISIRKRYTVAEINAGATHLPAPGVGFKYRVMDMAMIAVGGAATGATDVRILGTRAAGSVALLVAAVAGLTQSTFLRAGAANAAILADGASHTALDENTAVTVGKTGGALATATHVDVFTDYVIERV